MDSRGARPSTERFEAARIAEDPRAAGDEVIECMRVLQRGGIDLVSEVLRGQGTFYEMEHYPPNDVFDDESRSQYHYHAHREGEHGHFHTFLRGRASTSDEAITHLVGISMDAHGVATRLFTVNRWVTGDTWHPADAVIRMLDGFRIDHAWPSWPVNRWLTAMVRLFRPQIECLLLRRDEAVAEWKHHHPDSDVFEDRRLEVTSELPIDIDRQVDRVRRAHAVKERNPDEHVEQHRGTLLRDARIRDRNGRHGRPGASGRGDAL